MKYLKIIPIDCPLSGSKAWAIEGSDIYNDDFSGAPSGDTRLLAHDIVEHVNGVHNIGSIEDELQALGGVWFTRGHWGDFGRSIHTPYDNLANDFCEMFRLSLYQGKIKAIEKQKPTDYDCDLKEILKLTKVLIKSECEHDDYSKQDWKHFKKFAKRWSQNGIHKAQKKYGDINTANRLFNDIKRELDRETKYADSYQEIRLGYKFKNGVEVKAYVIESYDY